MTSKEPNSSPSRKRPCRDKNDSCGLVSSRTGRNVKRKTGQHDGERTKQGYLDAFAPAQPDPDGLVVSSSELDVIFNFDGVFFFFPVVFFAGTRRRGGHLGSRGSACGCLYVRVGSIAISPLLMSG